MEARFHNNSAMETTTLNGSGRVGLVYGRNRIGCKKCPAFRPQIHDVGDSKNGWAFERGSHCAKYDGCFSKAGDDAVTATKRDHQASLSETLSAGIIAT